jgi:hypothetical protein
MSVKIWQHFRIRNGIKLVYGQRPAGRERESDNNDGEVTTMMAANDPYI